MNYELLTDVSKLTRDKVAEHYAAMIYTQEPDSEIIRVNQLILSKWSNAGLRYIKEKAWKLVEQHAIVP